MPLTAPLLCAATVTGVGSPADEHLIIAHSSAGRSIGPFATASGHAVSDAAEMLEVFLAGASVDEAVFLLRPDYRALLVAVGGLAAGESDEKSEVLLRAAEEAARAELGDWAPEELPHVAAWRDAYRSFGARPQRTRNSLEALLRRAATGLPRVNRLTDMYNAVSVLHRIPLGGEDLTRYAGRHPPSSYWTRSRRSATRSCTPPPMNWSATFALSGLAWQL